MQLVDVVVQTDWESASSWVLDWLLLAQNWMLLAQCGLHARGERVCSPGAYVQPRELVESRTTMLELATLVVVAVAVAVAVWGGLVAKCLQR